MSTTVDERVVEMRFDNQQFESNVATTMSTLDKLKQGLKLNGAAKGLEDVGSAAKGIDLSGLGTAVEVVKTRFSALEVMGVTALANITNSAVNAGKKIVSALTIDPIKTGLSEYETQINAVQTILANTESKGTTLGQVNAALDELNAYADKTIYNFTEMTRNIGTFTAAGVDLKTSVNAIQGIANLAAVSGSNSQQASTAMYQLSQALSSGTVKLMDWNSVVNAGMGGQVFQDALKETARVHGVAIDSMIESNGSFRETLQEGWLTADILTETLSHFTMAAEEGSKQWDIYKQSLMDGGYTEEQAVAILKLSNSATDAATKVKTATQLWDTLKETAQSGWTQTWEIIMGDFGEAKELFSELYETLSPLIEATSEARNAVLSEGLLTGWKQLINQGIPDEEGYRDSVQSIAKEHGVAIDEMIEKEGSFEAALKAGLKDGSITSDMLSESVTHLADKMRNMSDAEREAAGYTKDHILQIEELEEQLKNGSISMDEFAKKILRPSGRENLIQSLRNAFDGLMNIIGPAKDAFSEIFPPITGEQLYNFTEKVRDLTASFKEFTDKHGDKIRDTFEGIFSVIDIGWTFIKDLAGGLVTLISQFSGLGSTVLDGASSIGKWLSNLRKTVKETDYFGIAVDRVVGFLTNAIDKVKEFGRSVKEYFKSEDFQGFLGFFEGLWGVFSKIGSKIGKILEPLFNAIRNVFSSSTIPDLVSGGLLGGVLAGIIGFGDRLTGPLEGIKELIEGVAGEGGIFDGVKDTLDSVRGCFEAYQTSLQADTLKKIATAIAILAASIFVISSIDADALDRSLGAVAIMFGELIASLAIFSKLSVKMKGVTKAIGLMTGLGVAVLILSFAMKNLASLDWEGIGKGLVGIGALMAELSIFLRTAKFDGKLGKAAIGMMLLGAAMKIFASAISYFTKFNWEEIGKGLAAIGGLLVELGLFANLTRNSKNLVSAGVSVVLLGAAMKIFASAIGDFTKFNWEQLGRGMAAMAGSLLAVALALKFIPANSIFTATGIVVVAAAMKVLASALSDFAGMSWDEIARGLVAMGVALAELTVGLILMTGTLSGSAALLIATAALAILVPVLKSLGDMSWGEIAKGLVAIAGALAILGIASYLLMPLAPTMLMVAGAFALFGVGSLAVGVGLTLIASGITAVCIAVSSGATILVAAIALIITEILNLLPIIIAGLGDAIVALCKMVAECAPAIAEAVLIVVTEILQALATYIVPIGNALFDLLIGALNVLSSRMPELIVAAMNVIGSFFQGIIDALSSLDTTALIQGTIGVGLIAALMAGFSALAGLVPGALVGVLGMGVFVAELALVLAAIGALGQIPGLHWLIGEGGQLLQAVGTALGQFIGGIVGGIGSGASSSLPDIASNLSTFMTNLQPFIDGAAQLDASLMDGVTALVGAILGLTAADLLSSIASFVSGGNSISDFATQLAPLGEALNSFSSSVAGLDTAAVANAASAAKSLAEMASSLPNSGGLLGLFMGENDMSTFGEQLVPFGEALTAYSEAVAGVNNEAIIKSTAAAKSLTEMASGIPNSGGLLGLFMGENDMSTFAQQLIPFGEALTAYSEAVTGVDNEAIIKSTTAAQALTNMASGIPNSGGLLGLFMGENDMSMFGTQLVPFGQALADYSAAVTGIDTASIVASATAAKSLSAMAEAIPNSGGLISWFSGDNDLATFATQLIPFGYALRNYSDAVMGLNAENISTSVTAASSLCTMAEKISGAQVGTDLGTIASSLATFANYMVPFGMAATRYSYSVTGLDVAAIVNSRAGVTAIVELANEVARSIPGATGIDTIGSVTVKLIPLGTTMTKYSNAVSGLDVGAIRNSVQAAGDLVGFINQLATVNTSGVASFTAAVSELGNVSFDGFISAFDSAATKLTNVGSNMIDSIINGFKSKEATLNTTATTAVTSLVTSLKSQSPTFTTLGTEFTTNLVNGLKSKSTDITTTAKSIGTQAVNGAKSNHSAMKTAGKDLGNGLILGIKAKYDAVYWAAYDLGKKAVEGEKAGQKSASPSKETIKAGKWLGEGLVIGMQRMGDSVYKAGYQMGENAIGSISSTIRAISDMIDSDIDAQPTIRPVLDLSDVKSGASTISSLFGSGTSVGLLTNVGAINSMMNRRGQNGDAEQVVSAINKLSKQLENAGNTYNTIGDVTYDDGSNINTAVEQIVRAARIGRRA